jgi:chorismate lyase/3-hydroxybenzoate synthase
VTNKKTPQNLHIEIKPELSTDDNAFVVEYADAIALKESSASITIPLIALDNANLVEHWTGAFTRVATDDDMVQIYTNDHYLFAAAPIALVNSDTLEHATQVAYSEIFTLIKAQGYPHLIRTWNFFPDIYAQNNGDNNYKLFCSGRTQAYSQSGPAASPYPAATVIGCQQPGLYIYYIASKHAGIGIENSKQVSAFEYPSTYSADPPLFSRALLHKTEQQDILFISGTASITGHQTQHMGNVEKQLALCISNIEHLLLTASEDHQFVRTSFSACDQIKVYLKDASHLAMVKLLLQDYVQLGANIHYLHGDMCRDDLLVEIETLVIHDKN